MSATQSLTPDQRRALETRIEHAARAGLESLREMRRALVALDFPTIALDEDIARLERFLGMKKRGQA